MGEAKNSEAVETFIRRWQGREGGQERAILDVRRIGHFGTGDLEISIKTKEDIEAAAGLLKASYEAS
jgi:predicted transport protein